MENKKEIIALMKALGFKETSTKNAYMLSFYPDEIDDPRINIYFTKMTVSIQWQDRSYKYYYNVTLSELEDIVTKLL